MEDRVFADGGGLAEKGEIRKKMKERGNCRMWTVAELEPRSKTVTVIRLWLWRLLVPGCPEGNDLCYISGAETDCRNACDRVRETPVGGTWIVDVKLKWTRETEALLRPKTALRPGMG